jgi:hypothetical protein
MTTGSPSTARRIGVLVAILAIYASTPSRADLVWYNGDFDNRDSQLNVFYTASNFSTVYDDFIIPVGQTWTITEVFSNNLMAVGINHANWVIRTPVSSGSGGTMLAMGSNVTATQTATGRSDPSSGLSEFKIDVSGISGVTLGAGTYWLAVMPIIPGAGQSFITTTSGANAVGSPPGNDGNSFVFSPPGAGNQNYVPTSDPNLLGAGTWDFSMGIVANVTAVPEPSTWALSGLVAVVGAGAGLKRRLRDRAGRTQAQEDSV